MSGYLGRLLQAGARSEQRLHPMAGSVYGERATEIGQLLGPQPGAPHWAAQDQSESEQTLASPTATKATELTTYLERHMTLQSRLDPRWPSSTELSTRADQGSSAARSPDQTRAMMPTGEPSVGVRTVRELEAENIDATQMPGRLPLRPPRSRSFAPRSDDAFGGLSEAVTMDQGAPISADLTRRHAAAPLAAELKVRTSDRHDEVARHTRTEGPEVQIHIGRIEVLAVQPPAPAAPAPRRETATRLADYLAARGGSGR